MIQTTALALFSICCCQAEPIHWQQQKLQESFVSEGASSADLDGDGHVDLISGPYWWKGPDFTKRVEYRKGQDFDPKGYSDHFFSFTTDVNGDGHIDVISVGFPGQAATAFINPGSPLDSNRWQSFTIADKVSNESPALVDLIAGGLPELVCSRDGQFGYYQSQNETTAPWKWHAVSEANVTANPFGHGLGIGDVDGDGRLDLLDPTRWWQQPEETTSEQPWAVEAWAIEPYGGGGAQILVHDVDDDGLNDIITSHNAHGYGLSWFAQKKGEEGRRRFIRNGIMGESSIDNPFGIVFSQLHGLTLADINNDGFQDVITGKRWWAHGGNDPGGNQAAVLYWFSGKPDAGGQFPFEPHLIDDDSGVGTEVIARDLNEDGRIDIVSANKKGVSVHFQTGDPDKSNSHSNQGRHSAHPDSEEVVRWDRGAEDDSRFSQSREPLDAVSAMQVPKGFEVDLVASEPELAQPIAMCFDARGRIWVAEGHTYPIRAPEGEGRDRILILEDTDSDGSFETQKIFADGLNLVSGIEIGFGGVWVGAAPYLMFIPDSNGDDVPDDEPRILLDGWGYQDTHETLNSFTWGPDGWLYGCHGVFTHSRVGKPGTPDEDRTPLNAAIWRYHPTRHSFEVFAWGGSNQWGIDYDDRGEWFMECCVIPHLFHVIQGARYHRQAGQHFSPYIYEDLPTIADHLHYGDGSFSSMRDGGRVDRDLVRRTSASTSMVGGGHAHCGMAVYLGDTFPEPYYGDLFFNNLHGHRIVRESVSPDGSGYVAHHRPDLVRTEDHSFVGVTVMLGPDGSLYFSDWHDPQTCHHRDPEVWDRSNGRIFRLRFGPAKSTSIDLVKLDDAGLIALLPHRNAMIARQAAHLLHQRCADGGLDASLANEQLAKLEAADQDSAVRLRLMWARHCCELLSDGELLERLSDADPIIRGWAIQLFCEQSDRKTDADWDLLAEATANESSLLVLRYLSSALQRIPLSARIQVARNITSHHLFAKDKNLPLLVWYAIEPLCGADSAAVLSQFANTTVLRDKVVRRMAATSDGRDAIAASLAQSESYDQLAKRLGEFKKWLPESSRLAKPPAWDLVRDLGDRLVAGRENDNAHLKEELRQLGVRMGDSHAFPFYRARALDKNLATASRIDAISLLRQAGDPEAGKTAAAVLDEPELVDAAARAIVETADPTVADAVVSRLPKMPGARRADMINFLASRASTAKKLIASIEKKEIESSAISAVMLRQMHSHDDPQLRHSIAQIWGKVRDEPRDFEKQKRYWNDVISKSRLAAADVGHGRFVYDQICGNCHKLHGQGQIIGPDLTGSNRRDLNYVLENVLAPNTIIGNAYQMHSFLMDDGRLITGLIRAENREQVRVVMAAGTEVTLDVEAIEDRKLSEQSMMPTELFDKMNRADVIDLVAYLAADQQVQPRAQRQVADGVVDPGNVTEAEWLIDDATPSAGNVRRQAMSAFSDRWSGDAQLWWTGAKKGATLSLELPSPGDGNFDVSLQLTTAVDYPIIRAKVNDEPWQSVDLFSKEVRQLAEPPRWKNVSMGAGSPCRVTLEMIGSNEAALKRWMLGIDRIEVVSIENQDTGEPR